MGVIAYYRVSTAGQGKSGLGLEAQKAEVERYLRESGETLEDEVTEVQSGKSEGNRPVLLEALKRCRKEGHTLVVAKLCRLSRDAAYVLTLMKDAKVQLRVASMPNADNLQLGIWAVLNQQERETISRRTKEALQAAKARGVRLGGTGGASASLVAMNAARVAAANAHAQEHGGLVRHLREQGMTLQAIATTLNKAGKRTPRGCDWTAVAVQRVLKRDAALTSSKRTL